MGEVFLDLVQRFDDGRGWARVVGMYEDRNDQVQRLDGTLPKMTITES